MKTETLLVATALVVAFAVSGCADMKDQAHHEPLELNEFFADGRSSRPLVEGTVARGHLREDDAYFRGTDANGRFIARMPVKPDAAMLARGRERYEIFCSPCHSKLGDGNGMVVQRGYKQAASYHSDRLRGIEDGYIYDVITNGFAQMQGYASQIRPDDRWAIVAYVRALQLSRMGTVSDLDPAVRQALETSGQYDPHAAEAGASHTGDEDGSAH